jgi:hypothetical protein
VPPLLDDNFAASDKDTIFSLPSANTFNSDLRGLPAKQNLPVLSVFDSADASEPIECVKLIENPWLVSAQEFLHVFGVARGWFNDLDAVRPDAYADLSCRWRIKEAVIETPRAKRDLFESRVLHPSPR